MLFIQYYYIELRSRFYYCLLSTFFIFCIVYLYINNFFYLSMIPISIVEADKYIKKTPYLVRSSLDVYSDNSMNITKDLPHLGTSTIQFIFTDVSEAFQTSILLSFFVSLFLITPFLLYNIWAFIIPSLDVFERNNLTKDFLLFLLVYILATYISIFIVFPFFWQFFLNFQQISICYQVQSQLRISSYISFLLYIIIGTHFFCEIPFLFFLLLKYNYLNISKIIKNRRIIYLSLLLFTAIVSPPEFITQGIIFTISLLFFEILVFMKIIIKKYKD